MFNGLLNQLKQTKTDEKVAEVYYHPYLHSIQNKYEKLKSLVSYPDHSLDEKATILSLYYELLRFSPAILSTNEDNKVTETLNTAKSILSSLTVDDITGFVSTYNLSLLTALFYEKAEAIYTDDRFAGDWDYSVANSFLHFNFETAAYINSIERFYFYWVHARNLNYLPLSNSIFSHPSLTDALNKMRDYRLGGFISPILSLNAQWFRPDIDTLDNNLYIETLDIYSSLFNDAIDVSTQIMRPGD